VTFQWSMMGIEDHIIHTYKRLLAEIIHPHHANCIAKAVKML
jgi:hypothetical protein